MVRPGFTSAVFVIAGIAALLLTVGPPAWLNRGPAEECPEGAACAPSNQEPVPAVTGMHLEKACRALGRSSYAGGVFAVKESAEVGPGRVLAQDPKPGVKWNEGGMVHLIVSEPFAVNKLRRNSNCVDRTDLGMEQFPVD